MLSRPLAKRHKTKSESKDVLLEKQVDDRKEIGIKGIKWETESTKEDGE